MHRFCENVWFVTHFLTLFGDSFVILCLVIYVNLCGSMWIYLHLCHWFSGNSWFIDVFWNLICWLILHGLCWLRGCWSGQEAHHSGAGEHGSPLPDHQTRHATCRNHDETDEIWWNKRNKWGKLDINAFYFWTPNLSSLHAFLAFLGMDACDEGSRPLKALGLAATCRALHYWNQSVPQKVKRCGTWDHPDCWCASAMPCQPFFMLHAIRFMLHPDITIAVDGDGDDDEEEEEEDDENDEDEDEGCGAVGGAVGDSYDDDAKTR